MKSALLENTYAFLRDLSFKVLPMCCISAVRYIKVPKDLKRKVSSMRSLARSPTLGERRYFLLPCLSKESVVYSFGVGRDSSFELLLSRLTGAEIWMFDPTPIAVEFVKQNAPWPDRIHFEALGCADYDGEAEFYEPSNADEISRSIMRHDTMSDQKLRLPVRRIQTIMRQLRHDSLDVLKIDVEGSEYAVLEDVLASRISIGQIVVEFHDHFFGAGFHKTLHALDHLEQAGYRIIWRNPNHQEMTLAQVSLLSPRNPENGTPVENRG